jgi:hypothetical protein
MQPISMAVTSPIQILQQQSINKLDEERRTMCHKTTCRKCQKPTWAGCGNHIEIALKGIPKSQRCQGHQNDPKEPGFFSKMFGKK